MLLYLLNLFKLEDTIILKEIIIIITINCIIKPRENNYKINNVTLYN